MSTKRFQVNLWVAGCHASAHLATQHVSQQLLSGRKDKYVGVPEARNYCGIISKAMWHCFHGTTTLTFALFSTLVMRHCS